MCTPCNQAPCSSGVSHTCSSNDVGLHLQTALRWVTAHWQTVGKPWHVQQA